MRCIVLLKGKRFCIQERSLWFEEFVNSLRPDLRERIGVNEDKLPVQEFVEKGSGLIHSAQAGESGSSTNLKVARQFIHYILHFIAATINIKVSL